jgi:broad specificity phosphatase PhoE
MKITFLRHAQSLFNKYLTSEKDCDLSPEGKLQAADLIGSYDVIILSPLRRTHQTLLYSKIRGRRILITELCREKRSDICDFLPGEDETRKESVEELVVRIDSFRKFLRENCSPDESVLVIAHGDFIFTAIGGEYPKNAEMRTWIL